MGISVGQWRLAIGKFNSFKWPTQTLSKDKKNRPLLDFCKRPKLFLTICAIVITLSLLMKLDISLSFAVIVITFLFTNVLLNIFVPIIITMKA